MLTHRSPDPGTQGVRQSAASVDTTGPDSTVTLFFLADGRPIEMRYCPQCGQQVEERDAFCFECGTQLDGPAGGQQSSLATVWAGGLLGVTGALESLALVLFAGEMVEVAESGGFGGDFSVGLLRVQGGFGLLLSVCVLGVCYYYYSQGYVEKRYFWGLILAGVVGFFFGAALSFLVLLGVGLYGLVVVAD